MTERDLHKICDKLVKKDPHLQSIIKAHGYPPLWTRPNTFETIVHIILEQQVSLASAMAALKKLQSKTRGITPAKILALSDEEMRNCYVSRQKSRYIRGLAEAIKNKKLNLDQFTTLPDEMVRKELTAFKGIGNWTADVYLMFVLQRQDIFPIGDLAAVNAFCRAKNVSKDLPRDEILTLTEQWKPYRTVATMILWHHYLSAPVRSRTL